MNIRPVGFHLFHSKLTDAFRNFANEPKNVLQLYYPNEMFSVHIYVQKHTTGVVVMLFTCYLFSLCGEVGVT
jgi:hypothetical protein